MGVNDLENYLKNQDPESHIFIANIRLLLVFPRFFVIDTNVTILFPPHAPSFINHINAMKDIFKLLLLYIKKGGR